MTSLQGKTAVVTGSSRGIGRAVAERLAEAGANVVITYASNRELADEVAAAVGETGVESLAVQLDLRDLESVRALLPAAINRFGQVDILVNNAAGYHHFAPTAQMAVDAYDSMFQVTRGVFFLLQEAAAKIADHGAIVSFSTGGTSMPRPGGGAYCGSKAAIEQFSNCLSKEIGARGVRVNTVAPGVTKTEGLVLDQNMVTQLIGMTPLGRLGEPSDIADAVALLCSDNAHWITGQNIRVTGGMV